MFINLKHSYMWLHYCLYNYYHYHHSHPTAIQVCTVSASLSWCHPCLYPLAPCLNMPLILRLVATLFHKCRHIYFNHRINPRNTSSLRKINLHNNRWLELHQKMGMEETETPTTPLSRMSTCVWMRRVAWKRRTKMRATPGTGYTTHTLWCDWSPSWVSFSSTPASPALWWSLWAALPSTCKCFRGCWGSVILFRFGCVSYCVFSSAISLFLFLFSFVIVLKYLLIKKV